MLYFFQELFLIPSALVTKFIIQALILIYMHINIHVKITLRICVCVFAYVCLFSSKPPDIKKQVLILSQLNTSTFLQTVFQSIFIYY